VEFGRHAWWYLEDMLGGIWKTCNKPYDVLANGKPGVVQHISINIKSMHNEKVLKAA
jgi:hypothetical protein